MEYGLTANGTEQVLWSLNQTAFPAHHIGPDFETVLTTKFTILFRPVAIVGGGAIGACIGQNVAFDVYGRHGFFRIQNTNGGSLFAVEGSNQSNDTEEELMQNIQNVWLKLELTANARGDFEFKATNTQTGAVAEYAPGTIRTRTQIMNLLFVAEGGGPQKYEFAWWRLDYD